MADVGMTDKQRRAELAAELGFYPADLDDASIARHRRLNAALDKAPDAEKTAKKFAHLHERRRQEEAEQAARAEVADLYEE